MPSVNTFSLFPFSSGHMHWEVCIWQACLPVGNTKRGTEQGALVKTSLCSRNRITVAEHVMWCNVYVVIQCVSASTWIHVQSGSASTEGSALGLGQNPGPWLLGDIYSREPPPMATAPTAHRFWEGISEQDWVCCKEYCLPREVLQGMLGGK